MITGIIVKISARLVPGADFILSIT